MKRFKHFEMKKRKLNTMPIVAEDFDDLVEMEDSDDLVDFDEDKEDLIFEE